VSEEVTYKALRIAGQLALGISLGLAAPLLAAESQEQEWDRMAAMAEQIYACRAVQQKSFPDPAAAALDLYQRAIQAVDQSSSDSSDARAVRGAFRANAVKRLAEIQARQSAWKIAFDQASKMHDKALQEQSKDTLVKAEPPACWVAAQELMAEIEGSRQELEKQLKEANQVLDRAQSSFDLKIGAKLFQDAIARFTQAQTYNVEDQRPTKMIAEAKVQLANITSPAKYEVLVMSDPGGAQLVLKGAGEGEQICPSTPCKFKFDEAFFRRSGGSFINSKRLLAPVVAVIAKAGYVTATVRLSDGEGVWQASVPGKKIREDFYYFTKRRFEVRLQRAQK
jgi:hypothetical protein